MPGMSGAIFISYRRADSADIAGRIDDQLVARFGRARVFKDVDSIPPGVPFPEYIVESISQSAVALVIIGPRWLNVSAGMLRGRRLDDPADFVRTEIEAALRLGVTVIPVLTQGATMPPAQRLPSALKPLAERNALQVRQDPDFRRDLERVIASIEYWQAQPRPSPPAAAPLPEPRPAPAVAAQPAPAQTPTSIRTPAARSRPISTPHATPPAKPSGARPSRSQPRRYQPLIAGASLLAIVALVSVTLYALGLFRHPGQTRLPAAAQTATALASAELAQSPTTTYGPTAPGSCDTGALKDDWTTELEFQHVRCAAGKALVTGPATFDFIGNGGINVNSTFSFTITDFKAPASTPAAGVTFTPAIDRYAQGRDSLPFFFTITAGGHWAISYLSGANSSHYDITPGPSGALPSTPDGSHHISLSFYPDRYTWTFAADGRPVKSFTYPSAVRIGVTDPQRINPLDIIVDKGASVTLSDFAIAIAS